MTFVDEIRSLDRRVKGRADRLQPEGSRDGSTVKTRLTLLTFDAGFRTGIPDQP